jgi:cathepsin L
MTADDLKALLVDSPVGALINADSGFMSYSTGVYSGCPASFATSYAAINHAVVIVGYDSNGNWIIKNSWGTGWG